jgi:hypothetical protein
MNSKGRIYKRAEGLEPTEVPDGCVIFDKNREVVHFLNPTAAVVFELCDGAHDAVAIAAAMCDAFDLAAAPKADVEDCLASLYSQGLVAPCSRWRHLWSFFSSRGARPISRGSPKRNA